MKAKGSNTSNLFSHLRVHHQLKFAEVQQAQKQKANTERSRSKVSGKQATIGDVVQKSNQYERGGKKWKQLTDTVTFCLAKDMLPIYSVEKEGFRKMLYIYIPRY